MRLQDNPYFPSGAADLVRQLDYLWRQLATQVNQLSEGQVVAVTNAATTAPTGSAVSYAVGDFILNSTPSELGTAGSKYIIHGWRCTVAGAPGTWLQCRFLTGN